MLLPAEHELLLKIIESPDDAPPRQRFAPRDSLARHVRLKQSSSP